MLLVVLPVSSARSLNGPRIVVGAVCYVHAYFALSKVFIHGLYGNAVSGEK